MIVVVDSDDISEVGPWTLMAAEVTAAEVACDDGFDDDFDGLPDCVDDGTARPIPPCAVACPEVVLAGNAIDIDLQGLPATEVLSCEGTSTPGSDVTVEFTAPADGRYVFTTDDAPTSHSLAVFDGCGGVELACEITYLVGGSVDVYADLVAGQTVVVVINDTSAGTTGVFNLGWHTVPAVEGSCSDGIDDDADGQEDCADVDCSADPVCFEDCANGVDDNDDGNIDCLDNNCAADPICAPVCPDDTLAGPGLLSGNTLGQPNHDSGTCGGGSASDHSVAFIAPADGTYAFALPEATNTFDGVLYVRDGCAGAELGCDDAIGDGGELVTVDLLAGQTAVAFVDGWLQSQAGKFELSVSEVLSAEIGCDDGLDDDLDGAIDCADDECAADVACAEDCSNDRDDNGSGLIDCADPACGPDPVCDLACPELSVSTVPTVLQQVLVGKPRRPRRIVRWRGQSRSVRRVHRPGHRAVRAFASATATGTSTRCSPCGTAAVGPSWTATTCTTAATSGPARRS